MTQYLRPEAVPIPSSKLQKRSLKALNQIIGTLNAAVKSTEIISENQAIDKNRASRIFFVSGEPGSGKTTLYLTLRAMLIDNKYNDSNPQLKIDDISGAIRWLDTLDLEVAGEEGENLLAAVLVRIIEKLTNRENNSNTIQTGPCENAIKDLEDLATDIGIAWEGNLQARAGALDPDTYSEEVMRTQRARLRVNERLKKSLDTLAKNECYGCKKNTLFVLPVDDFYLKPDASLQLLRLLRMISIPRLFFLVMGDIKTIEALFVEKSLADWTAVAGDRIYAARSERLDEALGRARELRARYLRKLLPPRQRAEIEAMDWDEALDFVPEQLNASERITLNSLLQKIKLFDKSDQNLLKFIVNPPYDKSEDKSEVKRYKKKATEAYTALQILDATSREVMDIWFALDELKDTQNNSDDEAPQWLSYILDSVKFVIEEQNFLNEKQQEILYGVLPIRHYAEQEIYLNMENLSLLPEQNTWISDAQNKDESNLYIRKHRSWKLTVKTDDENSENTFAKLPPRQTAWIVLLHDLVWKWKRERVTGNLIENLCEKIKKSSLPEVKTLSQLKTKIWGLDAPHLIELVKIIKGHADSPEENEDSPDFQIPNDFQGWAVYKSNDEWKHFPMPQFNTFQDLDRFLYVWNKGVEWLKDQQNKSEQSEKNEWVTNTNSLEKYKALWGLAGQTIFEETYYEDFAKNGQDWYKKLISFNYSSEKTEYKEWLDKVGNFPQSKKSKKTQQEQDMQPSNTQNGENHEEGS